MTRDAGLDLLLAVVVEIELLEVATRGPWDRRLSLRLDRALAAEARLLNLVGWMPTRCAA